MSEDADKLCAFCGKLGTKRCSQCRAVWYCCIACQKTAWPSHKQQCCQTKDEGGLLDPELFAIVQQRKAFEQEQAKARAGVKDQITHLLAVLISKPRDPDTHFELAYAYSALLRVEEAVETLGKALTFLLTTHPSADMELEVLHSAPPLLERALNGRGEADWVKEEQVARQLVDFAERVVPLHLQGGITAATPEVLHGALSSARRALAGYLARRGKHAEIIAQFYLADEAKQEQSAAAEAAEAAATLGSGCSVSRADGARSCRRDLVALKTIAEEAMCLAHESEPDSADRSEHVSHAIRAAREALRATPAIDEKAKVQAQMLLARMLYTSLTIRTAPKSGEGQSDAVAPSNKRRPLSEQPLVHSNLRPAEIETAREATALAKEVRNSSIALKMPVMVDLADMLLSMLPQPPDADA